LVGLSILALKMSGGKYWKTPGPLWSMWWGEAKLYALIWGVLLFVHVLCICGVWMGGTTILLVVSIASGLVL
jgi:hypothetical protein